MNFWFWTLNNNKKNNKTNANIISAKYTCVGVLVVTLCSSWFDWLRAFARTSLALSVELALSLRSTIDFLGKAQVATLAHAGTITSVVP